MVGATTRRARAREVLTCEYIGCNSQDCHWSQSPGVEDHLVAGSALDEVAGIETIEVGAQTPEELALRGEQVTSRGEKPHHGYRGEVRGLEDDFCAGFAFRRDMHPMAAPA